MKKARKNDDFETDEGWSAEAKANLAKQDSVDRRNHLAADTLKLNESGRPDVWDATTYRRASVQGIWQQKIKDQFSSQSYKHPYPFSGAFEGQSIFIQKLNVMSPKEKKKFARGKPYDAQSNGEQPTSKEASQESVDRLKL